MKKLSAATSFSRSNKEAKEGIAVCSKSLSHLEDNSLRIIEWIELLRVLGVSKIILSVLSVHPNVLKVKMDTKNHL